MSRCCVCAVLFFTAIVVAAEPITRPTSQPATRPAKSIRDENNTTPVEKYTGPENVPLEYAERQAYQKELKAAAKETLPGMDALKNSRDKAARQLADAQDARHADDTARFLTQGTRWKKISSGSSANLSHLRKALAAAEQRLDMAESCQAINIELCKLAVHYKYRQYRTAWLTFRSPVQKMNAFPDPSPWYTPYPRVLSAYRRMKAEAGNEYAAAYDKFIRPMKVNKDSLLAAILRDTGVPREQPSNK